MDNRVKSVSVMDAQSPEKKAVRCSGHPDAMVLLLPLQGCVKISAVSANRCGSWQEQEFLHSAIFQRERHAITKQLEPALITTADEVGLPLIVMVDSEEMDYAQIIEDVMEEVLHGKQLLRTA